MLITILPAGIFIIAINIGFVALIHRAEIREHARRRKGGQYSEGDVVERAGFCHFHEGAE